MRFTGTMLLCSKTCCNKDVDDGDKKNQKSVPVYLNVYDMTPINVYAYWLGLGVHHSGVQVGDVEYAFGAHEYPTTGIFKAKPKQSDGFTFRKTILIGKTEMEAGQVRTVMEELAEKYKGNAYNLITKNCNHFCNDVCVRLTGNPIPSWVNRLARIGFLCNCVLPASLNVTKVSHHRIEEKPREGETKKLTSGSNRFTSSNSPSSSLSPAQTRGRSRSGRRALPQSSPSIIGSSSS